MKYEYEAVSGDQSLFDIVNAYDFHTMIVRYKGCIYSTDINAAPDEVIAERKVKEVKLPVVGDIAININSDCIYKVSYVSKSDVVLEVEDGSCFSMKYSGFDSNYNIIDQSKQPNPVNMVEEKWVPDVGDKFKLDGVGPIFLCTEKNELEVAAKMIGDSFGWKHAIMIKSRNFTKA